MSNDATYGHDVHRATRAGDDEDGGATTTVRLSLLRAPLYPDPEADQGRHVRRVTIRPSADIAAAVEEGYRVNLEPRVVRGERDIEPLVTVEHADVERPSVVVEAVKLAEDRSGDIVVRVYESLGDRASATVRVEGATSVTSVDLLERADASGARPCGDLTSDPGVAHLQLRPFQLATLRFTRGG